MTSNTPETPGDPFGGFDMNALLQQAQAMQQQVMDAQAQLAETTVDGTGDLVGVKIRRGSFDPDDTEDLEDLIVAAYRDAKAKADALAAQKMGPLAGGLPGMG